MAPSFFDYKCDIVNFSRNRKMRQISTVIVKNQTFILILNWGRVRHLATSFDDDTRWREDQTDTAGTSVDRTENLILLSACTQGGLYKTIFEIFVGRFFHPLILVL